MNRRRKGASDAPGSTPMGDHATPPSPPPPWEQLRMQLEAARLVDPPLLARRWLAQLRGDRRPIAEVAAGDGVQPDVVRQHVCTLLESLLDGEDPNAPTTKVMQRHLRALQAGREIHDDPEREKTIPAWLRKPAERRDDLATFSQRLASRYQNREEP